ncbi:MAG: PAS domain S-box protein [Rubrivivax sp.]|nr:PAS domain S-box protein [Pyrinomonadaceae bacterium]
MLPIKLSSQPEPQADSPHAISDSVHAGLDLATDVAEQSRVEEQLRRSRERVEELINSIEGVVWEADPETFQYKFVSRQAEKLLGYPVERWLSEPDFWVKRLHPEDRDWAVRYCIDAVAKREAHTFDYRLMASDGRVVWVRDTANIKVEDDQAVCLRGTMFDITERRRSEDALRASEERFHAFMDNSPALAFMKDEEGRHVYVSRPVEIFFDKKQEEWIGKTVAELWPEDVARRLREDDEAVFASGRAQRFIETIPRPDGEMRSFFSFKFPIIDPSGRRLLAGMAVDITEQVRAEEGLARLAAIVESSDDAIVSETLDGVITSWNGGAERLYGYAESEMVGRHISTIFPPDYYDAMSDILERIGRGERVPRIETMRRRKDGQLINVSITASAITDSGGSVMGAAFISRDITGQKAMEAQLLQSQKMESVGRLAGGVAHDFNNLLTVVNGYGELALRKLAKGDPLRPYIEEIRKAGERAANLTRQLLAFSRKQILQPKVLDLNDYVAEANRMLRRLIGEDIEIVLALRPNLWKVRVDPSQLDQVLVNLVVNARDAMQHGGRVTVRTDNVTVDAETAHRGEAPQPGPHVLLTVSDTGHGMDEGTRARIFEPFFTTKDVGKGTGLGLSTVYGIISQSGGFVTVESEPERGAAFKIYLPRVEEEAREAHADAAAEEGLPRGTETILLAEDEEVVRTMTKNILEECGYTVLAAADGKFALDVAASHGGEIDLLLTDVVMPQMSGRRLAEHMKTTHPGTRVLYMSGYTDDAILRHGVIEETAAFMEKPYSPDALARKVREVLDA